MMKKSKDVYAWITPLLGMIIAMIFTGDIWLSPDKYVFASGGDGLQTYYQSSYHVQNDTALLHQDGLNYPYGESIFFTGGQPLFSNVVKVLVPVIDLSEHMVGITNYTMLIGFLLCPLFLYLILVMLHIPRWQSMVLALGLTFLSQQIERFTGHYPLAYLYAVPGMIWLLMKYHQSYKLKWSIVIGLYLLFLVFCHLYYLVFFGVIAFAFWMIMVVLDKKRHVSLLMSLWHLTIQLIIPFLMLQLAIILSNEANDRTSIPWGFSVFRSTWASYIFPYGMWYEPWLDALRPQRSTEWEGLGYIGGAAMVMLVTGLFFSIFRFRKMYLSQVAHDNRILISLALSVVLCIAISFTFPFNYGFENLLQKLGPLQQFRGIGRFAMIAFYPINILLAVVFFRIPFPYSSLRNTLFILLSLLTFSEGYSRFKPLSERLHHERGDLLNGRTSLPASQIDGNRYQAILPLPLFHIGSENVWYLGSEKMWAPVFDLSLRLKKPSFAALMSRTSLSQTYKTIGLVNELMELPAILKDLPDNRPLLLVCDTLVMPLHQRELLQWAKPIHSDDNFLYYELPLTAFSDQLNQNQVRAGIMANLCMHDATHGVLASTEQTRVLANDTLPSIVFDGKMQRFFEDSIPVSWLGKTVRVSFWVKGFTRDLIPRTLTQIAQFDGEKVVGSREGILGKELVGLKNGDALVEFTLDIAPDAKTITLAFENKLIPETICQPYSLLIRPDSSTCCILRGDKLWVNNRTY